MQCRLPRDLIERHKTEGLGFGRFNHFHRSMPIRSDRQGQLVDQAMLTLRKMFSSSLVISAVRARTRHGTWANSWARSAASSAQRGVRAPTTLGVFSTLNCLSPG